MKTLAKIVLPVVILAVAVVGFTYLRATRPQATPAPVDFFDCLSYYKNERMPYTGRAQSVNLDGGVTAEGFFQEGRPEGLWTRWHDNGQKREEFFITEGECARAQHWDEDGVPI